jgi:hypothetical protein
VYLDGVRQLAGTDFTASGTVLTFTTAPANGVGVDVYFLGLELSIPTPADATVTTAKIAANAVDETKLKDALVADFTEVVVTASDSILLGDATDSGNTKRDTVQGIIDLAGVAGITSSANATAISISADEQVNMPLQPCFQVAAAAQTDQSGDGTVHTANLTSEIFDVGGNFASKQFTAPVTGKYLLCASIIWAAGQYGTTDGAALNIVTSNRSYHCLTESTNVAALDMGVFSLTHVADMDATDVASMTWMITGGSKTSDHVAGQYTLFSGILIA